MSDSEFEEIGYSDLDSHNTRGEEEAKCTETRIVVELPPQLITVSKSHGSLPQINDGEINVKKDSKEDSDSSQSSFIPVTRLNCLNIEEDKLSKSWTKVYRDKNSSSETILESDASYGVNSLSHADEESAASSKISGFHLLSCNDTRGKKREAAITYPKSTSNDDIASVYSWNSATTNATISASSVISGFDILSLNGTSKYSCRRCTFFNPEKCTICKGCGAALVANPCFGIDEQIALNLHQHEEHDAFQRLCELEIKRNNLPIISLLEQSNILVDDIRTCIGTAACTGIETLPAIDLRLHTSSFIEDFKVHHNSNIKIGYYFSSKFNIPMGYNSIRLNGFSGFFRIHQDVESAYRQEQEDPRFDKLFSINENLSFTEEINKLGWIVAMFEEPNNQGQLDNSILMKKSSQRIPLVTFDAAMRNDEIIQVISANLRRSIQDFFFFLDQPIRSDSQFGMESRDQNLSNKRIEMDEVIVAECVAVPPPWWIAKATETVFLDGVTGGHDS